MLKLRFFILPLTLILIAIALEFGRQSLLSLSQLPTDNERSADLVSSQDRTLYGKTNGEENIYLTISTAVSKDSQQSVLGNECKISPNNDLFSSNRGEGRAALYRSGLTEVDLRFCGDGDLLSLIALDSTMNLDDRNEAMNGLRASGYSNLKPLLEHILSEPSWGDDYRAYAMQHLDLMMFKDEDVPSSVIETLGKYTEESFPDSVRREAVFGLLEIQTTREYGLGKLTDFILNGQVATFGDMYIRAIEDYQFVGNQQLLSKIEAKQAR